MATRTAPPTAPPTVSPTSAERFAARVRARRRRTWAGAAGAVLVVAVLAWAALAAPWATVERVRVSGTSRVDRAAVADAAGSEAGHPMLTARTGQVEAGIRAAQPLVRSVTVSRHWPSELRITVVERSPAAAVKVGGRTRLVDVDGVPVATVARAPKDLPTLDVDLSTPTGVAALRACLEVVKQLPEAVSGRVEAIGADSPDGVRLTLQGGATVQWGNSARTPLKARVLEVLLRQKAREYDLRSPGTPAVRRR